MFSLSRSCKCKISHRWKSYNIFYAKLPTHHICSQCQVEPSQINCFACSYEICTKCLDKRGQQLSLPAICSDCEKLWFNCSLRQTPNLFRCDYCGINLSSKRNKNRHVEQFHYQILYICSCCTPSQRFQSEKKLHDHEQVKKMQQQEQAKDERIRELEAMEVEYRRLKQQKVDEAKLEVIHAA